MQISLVRLIYGYSNPHNINMVVRREYATSERVLDTWYVSNMLDRLDMRLCIEYSYLSES